jgi:hypothetical protein
MDVVNRSKENTTDRLKEKRSISAYVKSFFDARRITFIISIVLSIILFLNLTWALTYYLNKYDKNSEGLIFTVFNFFGLLSVLYILFIYLYSGKYDLKSKNTDKYYKKNEDKINKEIEYFTNKKFLQRRLEKIKEENPIELNEENFKETLKDDEMKTGKDATDSLRETKIAVNNFIETGEEIYIDEILKDEDNFNTLKKNIINDVKKNEVEIVLNPKINITPKVELKENTYFSIFKKLYKEDIFT